MNEFNYCSCAEIWANLFMALVPCLTVTRAVVFIVVVVVVAYFLSVRCCIHKCCTHPHAHTDKATQVLSSNSPFLWHWTSLVTCRGQRVVWVMVVTGVWLIFNYMAQAACTLHTRTHTHTCRVGLATLFMLLMQPARKLC